MPSESNHRHTHEDAIAEIHNAWIAELTLAWKLFNDDFLGGQLRAPQIVILASSASTLGQWNSETRQLGIQDLHLVTASWRAVQETLRHEMAHQAVDELDPGRGRGEGPHGATFRFYCERLHIRPSATLAPEAVDATSDTEAIRVLRRIEKLLSLAGSPNENEANAAFRKARRLMVEHRIAEVDLSGGGAAAAADCSAIDLGHIAGRHHAWEFVLANILGEFFFVDVIWAHAYDAARQQRGTVLRVYGTRVNLDMAEYVYAFLHGVVEPLWQSYRVRNTIRGNRDRLRYYQGLMEGFASTLREQNQELQTSHDLARIDDPRLRAFFEADNPRIRRTTRGGGTSKARSAGENDGKSIRLTRPIAERGGGMGGLLGSSS